MGHRCPKYIIEWRSKEEYCMVGYYPKSDREIMGKPVIDNYAGNITGRTKSKTTSAAILIDHEPAIDKLQRPVDIKPSSGEKTEKPAGIKKKSRTLMTMDDIPDDYEKEFWK